MNKTLKWVGMIVGCLFFLALLASCHTSRRLGCPMKITHHTIDKQSPWYLQSKVYAYAPHRSSR